MIETFPFTSPRYVALQMQLHNIFWGCCLCFGTSILCVPRLSYNYWAYMTALGFYLGAGF